MSALIAGGAILLGLLTIHTSEGSSDGGTVMFAFFSLLASLSGAVVEILRAAVQSIASVPALLLAQGQMIIRLALLCLFAYVVHYFHSDFLTGLDRMWRFVLYPLIQFILDVGQLLRVLWGGFGPLYNFAVFTSKQMTSGSVELLQKCNMELLMQTVQGILETILLFLNSFFGFLGGDAEQEGSIFVNSWNFVPTMESLQTLILSQRELIECACAELSPFINVGLAWIASEHFPQLVHHLLNIALAVMQDLIRVLPRWSEFPLFKKVVYHTEGSLYEFGEWFDDSLFAFTNNLLENILKLEGIADADVPTTGFVGRALSQLLQGVLLLGYTVLRTVVTFALPIPTNLEDPDYLSDEILSTQDAWHRIQMGTSTAVESVHWFFSYTMKRIGIQTRDIAPLDCQFVPAFFGDRVVESALCVVRGLLRSGVALLAIGSSLPVEIVVQSLIFQERDALSMLQRFDGPTYPMGELVTCNMRHEAATDWDRSTDPTACACTDYPTSYPSFDKAVWSSLSGDRNTWCRQPQLQANVFSELEEAATQLSYVSNPLIQSAVRVGLHTVLQSSKVAIKIVLSFRDIIRGEFFTLPQNLAGGYGAKEEHLLAFAEAKGIAIVAGGCNEGWMQIPSGAPSFPADIKRGNCVPVHRALRLWNAYARANTGKLPCKSSNGASTCTCNPALGFDDRCQCMFTFPDAQFTIDPDKLGPLIYDSDFQRNWCGSQVFEPIISTLDSLGLALQETIDGFHPSPSSALQFCGSREYEVESTNVNHFTMKRYTREGILKAAGVSFKEDSCSIESNHDFLCAGSDAFRKVTRLGSSVARQIVGSGVAFISGRFGDVQFTAAERLCDWQKVMGAQAGLVSAILPSGVVSDAARAAIARLMFLTLQYFMEIYHLINNVLILIQSVATGDAFSGSGSIAEPLFTFVENQLGVAFDWLSNVIDAFGDLFDSGAEDAGAFFHSIADFIRKVESVLTGVLLEGLLTLIELVTEIVESFATASISTDLIKDIVKFLVWVKTLIPKLAMKLLGIILDALGPVGSFIKKLVGTICTILEDILNFILDAVEGITLGAVKLDDIDFGCLEGFGADGLGSDHPVERARRRLHNASASVDFEDVPKIFAQLGFEGTSYCDRLVRAYESYAMSDLRPIERETLTECVTLRALGIALSNKIGMPSLDSIFYDWTQKYVAVYRFVHTGYVYAQIGDTINFKQAQEVLSPVETREYLPAVRAISRSVNTLFQPTNVAGVVRDTVHGIGTALQTETDSKGLQGLGRVVHLSTNLTSSFLEHWDDHRMYDSFHQLTRIRDFDVCEPDVAANYTKPAETPIRVFGQTVQTFAQGARRLGATAAQKTSSYAFGAAGIRASTTPCADSISPICLNCNLLDNFIAAVFDESLRFITFYTTVYFKVTLPQFVDHVEMRMSQIDGELPRFEPWRPPIIDIFDRAYDFQFDPSRYADAAAAAAKNAAEAAGDAAGAAADAADAAADALEFGIRTSATAAFEATKLTTNVLEDLARRVKRYDLGADTSTMNSSYTDRARRDFEYFWENDFTFPADEEQTQEVNAVVAFMRWLTTADDAYVPGFGHGLPYTVSRPFVEKCSMETIYCSTSKTSERVKRLERLLWTVVWTVVAFVAVELFFLPIPLTSLLTPVSFVMLPVVSAAVVDIVYMYSVYGASVKCFPNIPVCLVDDLYAWVHDKWTLGCLCESFPSLVEDTCDIQTCLSFLHPTNNFTDCSTVPVVEDLGFTFSGVFWLRDWFPDVFDFLRHTPPTSYLMGASTPIEALVNGDQNVLADCAKVLILDNIAVLALLATASYLFSIIVPLAFNLAKSTLEVTLKAIGVLRLLIDSIKVQ